ncbi:MAG TPA: TonB family protein [Sphingomicrobium sp.]|nr:TonB family protein [Sphingomicrobium sp.]
MRSVIVLVMTAAMFCTVAQAKPREVRHLKPSSPWIVDYAEDTCRLARMFGEGRRAVTVYFEQFEPGDTFNMMFVGDSLDPRGRALEGSLRFGPGEQADDVTAVAGTTKNRPTIIFNGGKRIAPMTEAERSARKAALSRNERFELAPVGAAREKAVAWVELARLLPFDLVIETGPMDQPLAALRECSWDMVGSWGLDVEQQKQLSRKVRPRSPSISWFTENDYPAGMLAQGYQANVNFRLLVDETGKPTSCKIQSSTRPKAFDDVVCSVVMKRASFEPALDASGRPVRSFWRQSVSFRIEQ